jgi:exonuclease V
LSTASLQQYKYSLKMTGGKSIPALAHDLTTAYGSAPALKARQAVTSCTTTTPGLDNGNMAASTARLTNAAGEYGSEFETQSIAAASDYGSDTGFEDIDEDSILAGVLDTIKVVRPAERGRVLPSIEFEEGEREDEDHDADGFVQIHRPTLLRVARGKDEGMGSASANRDIQSSPLREQSALEVEYDERSRRAWSGTSTMNDITACLIAPD